ncbi:MAG TPA: class I SAM-dependent methyltransferase [Pyrinomonadaceae bacterium]|nr:class I SAM-dependent methyltransferase [Pyrinomonadaceae bacterium]
MRTCYTGGHEDRIRSQTSCACRLVYDLGCGDGRILISAARKYGARGFGVDMEPYRVTESQNNAKSAGVEHLVTFKLQDAMTVGLSPATVVTLYLVEWSTVRLQQRILRHAQAGSRIVSHSFGMDSWTPEIVEKFVDAKGETRTLYLWIVPERS